VWDEEGLDEDVAGRAPGGLPGDNVDVDEIDLQIEVVELMTKYRGKDLKINKLKKEGYFNVTSEFILNL